MWRQGSHRNKRRNSRDAQIAPCGAGIAFDGAASFRGASRNGAVVLLAGFVAESEHCGLSQQRTGVSMVIDNAIYVFPMHSLTITDVAVAAGALG